MTPEQIKTIFDAADTITTVALLLTMLFLFYRGDILSRRVYEQLTKDLVGKMVEQVTKSICEVIEERLPDRR